MRANDPNRTEQVQMLASSGLFDRDFYAGSAGLGCDLTACVEHYLNEGAAAGLTPSPLFDPGAYVARNPDVKAVGIAPFAHFVQFGIRERRESDIPTVTSAQIEAISEPALEERRVRTQASKLGWRSSDESDWKGCDIAVYASSLGSFVGRYIADEIADGLRADGLRVWRLDQNSVRPTGVDVEIVVAPQDFLYLGAGPNWQDRLSQNRSIIVNTELPGTSGYFLALMHASRKGFVVSLSPASAFLMQNSVRSGYLPLGWIGNSQPMCQYPVGGSERRGLEGFASLLRTDLEVDWSERAIDVLFLGTLTPRRGRALGGLAAGLAPYRCFIHAPTPATEPLVASQNDIGHQQSALLARNAKLLVNIHKNESGHLDWNRFVSLGIKQGAIVVSEPCMPYPGLVPGRHFITASLSDMSDRIRELLDAESGRRFAAELKDLAVTELAETFDLPTELRALARLHRLGIDGSD